jgi:hypothetical protein
VRWYLRAILLGWLSVGCSMPALGQLPKGAAKPSEAPTCGDYGTSLHFEKSPKAAASKARQEEKLVFVLHISGLFEDSEFT